MLYTDINQVALFFCFFVLFSAVLQFYLIRREINVLEESRDNVPKYFQDKISEEEHNNAIDYSLHKLDLKKINIILESLLIILFTVLGGLNLMAYLANTIVSQPGILRDLVLFIIFLSFNYLLTLPLTIYEIFGVEAKFGFNKMTPKLFLQDQIKGMILGLILLVPLLSVVLKLLQSMGNYWWLYTWLVWVGFSLLMLWLYPKWIAPIFNQFKPLEDHDLKLTIENLLNRTGFESNGIFVMDGSKRSGHANAYFSGFGKNKRIVFFDTILKDMSSSEIEAILAHELGHFKLKHVIKQMAFTFVMALLVLYVLGLLINNPWFYLSLGVNLEHSTYGMGLILFFLILPLFSIFIKPITSLMSRKNEYQADEYAAKNANAANLITALVKLYSSNASVVVTDKWYSFFYDSHPNAKDRIDSLEQLKLNHDH